MKYHDLSLVRLRRLAQLCAVVTAVIALVAMAGWVFGAPAATGVRAHYLPMAPNTALSLLLLGSALLVFCSKWIWRYRAMRVCGSVVLALATVRLGELATGTQWGVDRLLFSPPIAAVGDPQIGIMTLVAAIVLMIASSALLMLSWSANSRLLNSVAGGVGVIVAFTGLVFCLGYVYGSPLLYRGELLPMALNTALASLTLGGGIIAASAARETAERRLSRRRQRAQHAVTRVLALTEDPDNAIPEALKAVCRQLQIDFGAVWTKGRRDGLMQCTHVWHVEGEALTLFATVSQELTFSRGEDLPGKAEAAGEAVWVEDVANESGFPRRAAAVEAGLHGAFCGPMVVGGEFLGAVEFLSAEPLEADDSVLGTMGDICGQIAQYVSRKQAEQVLRQNELRTRLIIETANDAFIETDGEGVISDWNQQAETIFGWTRAEAMGRRLLETIISPKARNGHALEPERLNTCSEECVLNRRVEMIAMHRDGDVFPVELTVWPIESGDMLRYNVFIRDITDRKRAEEELAAKTAQLQQELEIAREFQEALLPSDYPEIPDHDVPDPLELHFHHVYKPAFTVGGDFFDVVKLSEHQAGIFIADVMGHGARSALITAILRTLIQDLAQQTDDPGRFLEMLNEHYMDIVDRSHQFVFASAFYLIIDTQASTAAYASAGHPSPLFADRMTKEVKTLLDYGKNGPALGFIRGATYGTFRRDVKRDDVFVLFTDGLVEAADQTFDEFGYERFAEVLKENLTGTLSEMSQAVIDSVFSFTGTTMLSDDLCLVAVEVSDHIISAAPAASGAPAKRRRSTDQPGTAPIKTR